MYFINIFEINYNYLKDDFYTNYIKKINIEKLTDDKIDKKSMIHFFNINGHNNIKYFKFKNLDQSISKTLDEIQKDLNHLATSEYKIGNLDNKIFYELDFSALTKSTFSSIKRSSTDKIIICVLMSNDIKINNNDNIIKLGLEPRNYEAIYDKTALNYNTLEIKTLLLLFKMYIDYFKNEPITVKKGGYFNKSYQLYKNDKNKYYIIYNKKNIYLTNNNTYKKNNKFYLKINSNNDIEIKY